MNVRIPSSSALGAGLVYLLLVGLTFFTWGMAVAGIRGLWATLLVLFLALFKGQMVADWFMGLREVHGLWRWVLTLWLLLVGALVSTAFVIASGG